MVLLQSNNVFHYFCLLLFCRIWAKTEEKVRNHESLYTYFYFRTSSSEGVNAPIQHTLQFIFADFARVAGQPIPRQIIKWGVAGGGTPLADLPPRLRDVD